MSFPTRGLDLTESPTILPSGRKFMFGIGIDYKNPNPYNQLKNAVKDLHDIKNVLVEKYDFEESNVFLLENEQATFDDIINRLDYYTDPAVLNENDSLLIYFAGHGYLDRNKRGYWVPVNSKPGNIASFIPNGIVKEKISDMKCRHVLLISDSCFSGTLLAESRGIVPVRLANELESRASRWIITSGRPDETVPDGVGQNSPFAEAILYELRNNRNAKLLADMLAQNVRSSTAGNSQQIPQTGKLFDAGDRNGQFVFSLRDPEPGSWELAQREDTTKAYEEFLRYYPTSIHAPEARERIKALLNQGVSKELTPEQKKARLKRLSPAEKANEILNQRTQEWVNNDRINRFMLTPLEWLFIKRHLSDIKDWGPNELTKKELLTRSTRRWYGWIGAGLVLLFITIGFGAWWQSSWRQIWQMEQMVKHISKSGSHESRLWAVRTLAVIGEPDQYLLATTEMYSNDKHEALSSIAEKFTLLNNRAGLTQVLSATTGLADNNKAIVLATVAEGFTQLKDRVGLTQVLSATTGMSSVDKGQVLYAIAEGFAQLRYLPGLHQILSTITLDNPYTTRVLSTIAKGFASLNDQAGLTQVLSVSIGITSYDKGEVLYAIAKAFIQLKDAPKAKKILTKVISTTSRPSNELLINIAEGFTQLKDRAGLAQVLSSANKMQYDDKSKVLTTIAQGFAQLKDQTGLTLTLSATDPLIDSYKANVLPTIAKGFAQLNNQTGLDQVLLVVNRMRGDDKGNVLLEIAKEFSQLNDRVKLAWLLLMTTRMNNYHKDEEVLSYIAQGFAQSKDRFGLAQVLPATVGLTGYTKARVIIAIANGFIQLKDRQKAKESLIQALSIITRGDSSYDYSRDDSPNSYKALLLSYIAQGFAQLKDRAELAKVISATTGMLSFDKGDVLSTIAKGYAQLNDRNGLNHIQSTSIELFDRDQVRLLYDIAEGFAQLKDTVQAKIIMIQALSVVRRLDDATKASFLSDIADQFAQLKDRVGLIQVLSVSTGIAGYEKGQLLPIIAQRFAQLEDWDSVNHIITDELSNEKQAEALYRVLVIWYTQSDPKRQKELLPSP